MPKEGTSDAGRLLATQQFSDSSFELHSKCWFFFYIDSVIGDFIQLVMVSGVHIIMHLFEIDTANARKLRVTAKKSQ